VCRLNLEIKTDWAAPSREKLLKLFENSIVVPSLERRRCIAAEKVWIDSMDDLYRYVNAHSSALLVVDGTITSSDPTVQQDLNAKIISEKARRQLFLKTKQEYAQMQAQAFRSLAIDPKGVGLQK